MNGAEAIEEIPAGRHAEHMQTVSGTSAYELGVLAGSMDQLSKTVRALLLVAVGAPLANIGVVYWTTDRMTDTLRHEASLAREQTLKELKALKSAVNKVKRLQSDEKALQEAIGATQPRTVVPAVR